MGFVNISFFFKGGMHSRENYILHTIEPTNSLIQFPTKTTWIVKNLWLMEIYANSCWLHWKSKCKRDLGMLCIFDSYIFICSLCKYSLLLAVNKPHNNLNIKYWICSMYVPYARHHNPLLNLERIVFFLAPTRFYLKKLKIFRNYTVVSSIIKLEACLN